MAEIAQILDRRRVSLSLLGRSSCSMSQCAGGGLGGDLFWAKKFCRPPRFGRTGGLARWRFRRFGIRTELVAIIPLAATLPGCILGQRSSARGARHQSIMHLILRNLAGSQTLRPTGWFLADEAMKPRRSRLQRSLGGVGVSDSSTGAAPTAAAAVAFVTRSALPI